MRLAKGIIIDKEKTFGVLKFSALRHEVRLTNEDGSLSEEIKERTHDLKSKAQGRMIQVSIPASVPLSFLTKELIGLKCRYHKKRHTHKLQAGRHKNMGSKGHHKRKRAGKNL